MKIGTSAHGSSSPRAEPSKEHHKGFMMDKDHLEILVFGHTSFGMRHLRIEKERFKMGIYLFSFLILSIMFFFCDYIQVKRKTFLLNQLRQESQIQKSYIQLFAKKTLELQNKLSRLEDIDHRIRIIANLERGSETLPFIGMGGLSPSVPQGKMKEDVDESQ